MNLIWSDGFKRSFKKFIRKNPQLKSKIFVVLHCLMNDVEYLIDSEKWRGLKSIGVVESERRIKGKETTIERRYYLTSLKEGVKQFAQGVRSHWGGENQLHWCLDVALREDHSRIRQGNSAENMALIRHLALNLLNKEKEYGRGKKHND
ncbi:MAG: ISAs1 family transposase [Cyanobacterium sp. T60_A2020_053]|nr:ISAs1 family transposase [Cyanobacterium sp. T60_A2020_053]